VRLMAIIVAFLLGLVAVPVFAADVGFEEVKIPNGAEPPLTVGIWYPTNAPATPHALGNFTQTVAPDAPISGDRLPLVVMSHGGAGWYDGHYDTAIALAQAGFVAAALSHAGDTFNDQSGVLQLWRRPAQLHRLVDYMLDKWRWHGRLDAARVGAFGFSNGGFTVLVAAGGIPDLSKIGPFCETHPDQDLCETLQHAGVDIHLPVQLWSAADDRHQPHPYYDEAVRDDLPRSPEYHVIGNAGHYDFLPPCDARLARLRPEICNSLPDFDRAAFHEQFNGDVVQFFRAKRQ